MTSSNGRGDDAARESLSRENEVLRRQVDRAETSAQIRLEVAGGMVDMARGLDDSDSKIDELKVEVARHDERLKVLERSAAGGGPGKAVWDWLVRKFGPG